jgi:hypothetical protein
MASFQVRASDGFTLSAPQPDGACLPPAVLVPPDILAAPQQRRSDF